MGLAGEVIQHHYRYMVAPPSIHPDTGKPYAWRNPLVAVDELPWLPQEMAGPPSRRKRQHEQWQEAEPVRTATGSGSGLTDKEVRSFIQHGVPDNGDTQRQNLLAVRVRTVLQVVQGPVAQALGHRDQQDRADESRAVDGQVFRGVLGGAHAPPADIKASEEAAEKEARAVRAEVVTGAPAAGELLELPETFDGFWTLHPMLTARILEVIKA